ncbi:hypothetical protein BK666_09520 [Pseudomonas frederiksbergensis]|uniref:Glycosyltransferase RgtA/B/C/D-like domain-containing protein n=1 Tax=Pseudomonas frederiksbergensis TaxID=104087 RepID=A0A423K9V5_9PSED|nr:glycosyltransferase family 39 protein [Pseudomonas frederiksbergensis]RON48651.1 hypothetical protein BK666_09520 [Pseudomonas frederiksbergensis]
MTPSKTKASWAVYTPLLLIVVVGALLRAHDLFEKSLWLDELFSVEVSDPDNSLSTVFHRTVEDVHPPLYQILLWLVYKVFGYSDKVGRVFSLVLGVAVIPSMYWLTKSLFNEQVARLAAFLSAINFFLVVISKDTRSYDLLVLLVVLSFGTFIGLLEKKNGVAIVIYSIVASMLVNTHYFGFFPVMTQFLLLLYFSLRSGLDRRLFMAGFVAAIVVFCSLMPVLPYLLKNIKRTGTWIGKPTEIFIVDAFVLQFGQWSVVLVCLFFLMLGLSHLLRRHDKSNALKILLLWWFFGFSVAYIRSLFFTPILSFRNTIIFIPVAIIIVSYGLSLVVDRVVRGSVLAFIFLMSISYLEAQPDLTKLRIEHDLRSPAEKIMSDNTGWRVYGSWEALHSTYFKALGSSIRVESLKILEEEMKQHQTPRCFYVMEMWGDVSEKKYPDRFDVELVEKTDFSKTGVLVFRSKGATNCSA